MKAEGYSIIVPTFFFFSQCLKTYKFCQYIKSISSKNRFIIRISCSTASHKPVLSMVPLYHRVGELVHLFMGFGSKTTQSQEVRWCSSSGMDSKAEHEAPCSATRRGLNSGRNPQSLVTTMGLLLFYRMVIFLCLVLDTCFDTKAENEREIKPLSFLTMLYRKFLI